MYRCTSNKCNIFLLSFGVCVCVWVCARACVFLISGFTRHSRNLIIEHFIFILYTNGVIKIASRELES